MTWELAAEICAADRALSELGRVCSQEELDAHFSAAASAEMIGLIAESPPKYGKLR